MRRYDILKTTGVGAVGSLLRRAINGTEAPSKGQLWTMALRAGPFQEKDKDKRLFPCQVQEEAGVMMDTTQRNTK